MTRINSAIPVKNLTDEHLFAEHREIKRLPYCLNKAIKSGSINRIQPNFTLGKGHVTFFLDKMGFIKDRYDSIYNELLVRHFDVTSYHSNFQNIEDKYSRQYQPTEEEKRFLIERIADRIRNSNKTFWHYYGRRITKDEAINILTAGL